MTTFATNSNTTANQTLSSLRQFANKMGACIIQLCVRRAQNASLSRLTRRDLKDIGLVDDDISSANSLPLDSDAAAFLSSTRQRRIGNW